MVKKATAPADDSATAEIKPLDAGLLRIQGANQEVETAHLEYLDAKTEAKLRKKIWENAVERLRKVIRQETEPLPLFDGVKSLEEQLEDEADEDERAQNPPADHTAEYERGYQDQTCKMAPCDLAAIEAIKVFRERQADGSFVPHWTGWGEFTVGLADGRSVTVVYDPAWSDDTAHFEFHGKAVSESGFRSHFEHFPGGKRPTQPLAEWCKQFAESLVVEQAGRGKKNSRKKKETA